MHVTWTSLSNSKDGSINKMTKQSYKIFGTHIPCRYTRIHTFSKLNHWIKIRQLMISIRILNPTLSLNLWVIRSQSNNLESWYVTAWMRRESISKIFFLIGMIGYWTFLKGFSDIWILSYWFLYSSLHLYLSIFLSLFIISLFFFSLLLSLFFLMQRP